MKTFYVTTPIYYANGAPHLGSLYTTMVADCITRYKRQRGFETFFLTGTDEHGVNIQRVAEKSGRSPREYTDFIVSQFKEIFRSFGLDTEHGGYDIFMRTTEPFHYEGVGEFWRRVARSKTPKDRDAIFKGFYEGWFCAPCAEYKTEEEFILNEQDAPTCRIHELPLDRVSEESYFFRLSDYDEVLLDLYEKQPDFILPEARRNEVISFVSGGLQDLSISRQTTSVAWGIPVPDDPSHSVYVWFDALTNYITALGFGNTGASEMRENSSKNTKFEKFWPALHLVGKDILRQHAVYWPAFLLAAGLEHPRAIMAHGMWQDRFGRKLSKTLGNSIEPETLSRYFSPDTVRYFSLREMPFGQDGKFSYEAIIDRANSDLASGLGNLTSRTLTMIDRYCGGRIPEAEIHEEKYLTAKRAGVEGDAMGVATMLEHARDQFLMNFDEFAFHRALETAWAVISHTDKFISDAKPWQLAKDDTQAETLHAVLYRSAETLRWLAVLLYPMMPPSMLIIWRQLGQTEDLTKIDPKQLKWGGLQQGTQLGEIEAVFPRLDKAKIMNEIEKESGGATQAGPVEERTGAKLEESAIRSVQNGATEASAVAKTTGEVVGETNLIGIDDFAKVEMRVGQILTAERVPKADKLLRFMIDVGEESPRQILAGIAQYYDPENLIGRKIAVVTNLQPRKLRGYESQGMVLAASVGSEGRPVLATFTEDVSNGARLK